MTVGVLFWDVDTQHDFMDEDGKLAVPGAQQIVPNLRRLTRFAAEHRIPIVASADAHDPDDPEFQEFGQHCVAGTPGQRKIEATCVDDCPTAEPGLLPEQINALLNGKLGQIVIEKQELDVFTVPLADRVLSQLRPERVYVYGVATEYCVLKTTLGLLERDYDVTVIRDAIKGIDEDDAAAALQRMEEAGADFEHTEQVLQSLTEA
ncbi:MAG: isochorismatase family cysteine hydrolase [Candidatus Brocadiia bacterium]